MTKLLSVFPAHVQTEWCTHGMAWVDDRCGFRHIRRECSCTCDASIRGSIMVLAACSAGSQNSAMQKLVTQFSSHQSSVEVVTPQNPTRALASGAIYGGMVSLKMTDQPALIDQVDPGSTARVHLTPLALDTGMRCELPLQLRGRGSYILAQSHLRFTWSYKLWSYDMTSILCICNLCS